VHERPAGIQDAELAAVLARHWQLEVAGLRYLPVGFGGYHWQAADPAGQRWFVTATEIPAADGGALADLTGAMESACGLAAAGLDFVVAPVRGRTGQALARLGPYAVTVFPYHDGVAGRFGDSQTDSARAAVVSLLARLHASTAAAVPVRPLQPPGREVLDRALRERAGPWTGGPFAEPARTLLAEHANGVAATLDRFDALVASVSAENRPPVITHGEPHPGNLLRSGRRLLLIDWDTAGLAAPERDLWWVLTGAGRAADRYARLTGHTVSPDALALYRLRWTLDDVCLALAEFRAPHARTADTEVSWAAMRSYLPALTAGS
jgi:spectinomycin phosphotransferase